MTQKTFSTYLSQAAVGALLSLPLAVLAQGGPPAKATAPAPASAAPAPAPAAPVTVTPEARIAIKELLDVTNVREGLTRAYGTMAQNLAPQMGQIMNRDIEANPSLSADQKQKVRAGMDAPFQAAVKDAQTVVTNPKLVDETIEKMIPIYAKYFTTAEVRQLTQFYRTPIGAKALTTMPQVSTDSIQVGIATFTPRVNAIIEKTMKAQFDAAASAAPAPAPAAAPAKK
jgi:uncharacterized protein